MLVLIAGCQEKSAVNGVNPTADAAAAGAEEEIKANLAKLGPKDQPLAEKQKCCAVMPEHANWWAVPTLLVVRCSSFVGWAPPTRIANRWAVPTLQTQQISCNGLLVDRCSSFVGWAPPTRIANRWAVPTLQACKSAATD